MKILYFTFLFAILGSARLSAAPDPSKAHPIPVLLVDGQSGGPYHAWPLTSAVLKKRTTLRYQEPESRNLAPGFSDADRWSTFSCENFILRAKLVLAAGKS
jgi:hypothetical protein